MVSSSLLSNVCWQQWELSNQQLGLSPILAHMICQNAIAPLVYAGTASSFHYSWPGVIGYAARHQVLDVNTKSGRQHQAWSSAPSPKAVAASRTSVFVMTVTLEAHAHTYITHTYRGTCCHEHCSLSPAREVSVKNYGHQYSLHYIQLVMHNIQVFDFQNLQSCVPIIATID